MLFLMLILIFSADQRFSLKAAFSIPLPFLNLNRQRAFSKKKEDIKDNRLVEVINLSFSSVHLCPCTFVLKLLFRYSLLRDFWGSVSLIQLAVCSY